MRRVFFGAILAAWMFNLPIAQATFIADPSPSGTSLNIASSSNAIATSGTVFGETINITADDNTQLFDSANGNATIKPINKGILNAITFTPVNDNVFSAFSFRGALNGTANGTVHVHWVASDNTSGDIDFTGLGSNADFTRVGIHSIDGETLKSVRLTADNDGWKNIKQFDLQSSSAPVPEPGTLTICLLGGLVGFAGKRFLKRRSIA